MTDREQAVLSVVEQHVNALGEIADVVQIFVSYDAEEGNTVTVHLGKGNVHARINMAREYVVKQDEREKISVRQEND